MKVLKSNFFLAAIMLATSLQFSSCNKYLDIQPKGYTIPTNVEDYSRLLNNETLIRFMTIGLDKLSDSYYIPNITTNTQILSLDQRIYFWLAGMYLPEDYQRESPWQQCYSVIYQYNAVIENIDSAPGGTNAQKAEIKAVARAGRAIAYWYLVNLYAPTYNSQTADTDLGIPIVLSSSSLDESTLPARSSVAQTYDFIITELTASIPALPTIAPSIYNMHQTAAYAFLARTYLYMADYNNAISSTSRVLETFNTVLDYNTIMTRNSDGRYTYSNSTFITLEANPENIYAILYTYSFGMAYSQVSDLYYDIYNQSEGDLRQYFYSRNIYPQQIWSQYTNGTNTDIRNFNINIGPTVPEMLLIRAESYARTGNIGSALTDLNTLRKNRILSTSYTDLQSNDAIEATGWVLDERKRELIGRGLRWFDMRRLNNDANFGFTAQRQTADGTIISLPPNSPRYVLQIPDVALTENITQNTQ